jgi:hypothetical protein
MRLFLPAQCIAVEPNSDFALNNFTAMLAATDSRPRRFWLKLCGSKPVEGIGESPVGSVLSHATKVIVEGVVLLEHKKYMTDVGQRGIRHRPRAQRFPAGVGATGIGRLRIVVLPTTESLGKGQSHTYR